MKYKKWTSDVGCPDGIYKPFHIDATVNSAYVIIGLLYGNGDFGKTVKIATRFGQDADCNPSSAAGIIGTMLGYNKIPTYWKQGLTEAESLDFNYTTMSLNEVYEIGFKHALEQITQNGDKVAGNNVTIQVQQPQPVRLEQSFAGHFPGKRTNLNKPFQDEYSFTLEGNGFVMTGKTAKGDSKSEYIFKSG